MSEKKVKKVKKSRYSFSLKDLIRFYTRFSIPWWMYVISLVLGLVYSELLIRQAEFTIAFNKGELFNSTIINFALLYIASSIVAALENFFSGIASLKVTLRARKTVWNKILHLPMEEVDRRQPSALISGITSDVGQASTLLTMIFLVVSSIYSLARAIIEVIKQNYTMSVILVVIIPLGILVFTFVGRVEHEVYKRNVTSFRTMTEYFSEHVTAAKNVKTRAMEDQEEEAGLKAIDAKFKADLYSAIMGQIQVACFSLYNRIGTVFTAIAGSSMIRAGKMESTGITDFDTYLNRVYQYTSEILTQYQSLRATQGALQYVGDMLEGPQEELDKGESAPEKVGDLTLEHVTFGYDQAHPVLNDLSVTIPAGKITALIGSNGSGKSTLLKLLQGVYKPDSGVIRMGGNDVAAMAPHALRKEFGYILQNNPLFSGTVRGNIMYGAPKATDEQITVAAKMADADGFIQELADGYDTDIGEGGKNLSGGQRQRVAIARTLLTEPTYLLMDEAGASLDHKSDTTIFRSVRENLKGHTIVVVAHDMRSVVEADHIIVLDHGTLEVQGSPDELLKTSPTYRSYLEKQGYALAGEGAAR